MSKTQNTILVIKQLTEHRPWGSYTILDESDGYKVKRILVEPGKRLSLQKHKHRSEHWTIVSGVGLVTIGIDEFHVEPNVSKYISKGIVHRLENTSEIPLVLIETQLGDYLGEDDIIRIEDDFNRIDK